MTRRDRKVGTGWRRVLRRVEVVALCMAAVVTVGPASAATDASAPAAPTTVATAAPVIPDGLEPRAPAIAIELQRKSRQLAAVDREREPVVPQLQSAQAAVGTVDGFLAQNATDLAVARSTARARAATAYVQSGRVRDDLATGAVNGVDAYASALQYAEAGASVDTTAIDRLDAVAAKLASERAASVKTRDALAADLARLDPQHDALTKDVARDQAQLDSWGALPVMGAATLSPAQIAAWYRSTGSTANLTPGTTIDDLAALYVQEGATEHVRGDVAFVQAMIETGGFRVDPGNNYAGIGTCDSCNGGFLFPTPRDGVRAQIQLLRNYADPDSRAADLANPPSPGIYGTAPGVAHRYDSFFLKGAAPLWNEMGGGNWATDPVYAPKVTGMYAAMLAYAFTHPV